MKREPSWTAPPRPPRMDALSWLLLAGTFALFLLWCWVVYPRVEVP